MKLQIIEPILISVILALAPPVNARILNAVVSQFSSFAGTQEEVSYTVNRKTKNYEDRTYPERNWACVEHQNDFTEEDKDQVFLQLFDYISGENDRRLRMPMTVPVSVQRSVTEEGEKVYHACFAIKQLYEENPPTPTNPAIVITTRPQMRIVTRQFGGYVDGVSGWLNEAEKLKQDLAGESIRGDIMVWNAYNSPVEFWNRRNEVWFVKN